MNAFTYYDISQLLVLADDKVNVNVNKEEFHEGLRYLNKLYKEGLIDPNGFIQDVDTLKQLTEKNPQIVGSAPAMWFGVFANSNGTNHKSYEAMPPLKGPKI